MSVKEKLSEEELNKVSGGIIHRDQRITCPNCDRAYDYVEYTTRLVEEGCTDYTEYTCPNCHNTFKGSD